MKVDIRTQVEQFFLDNINLHSKYVGHIEQRKEWEKAYEEFCYNIGED